MDRPTFPQRCQFYRGILESFLKRFTEIPPKIHLPKLAGLRRQHPNMLFHLTPELFLQQGGCTEFACPEDRFSLRSGEVALIPRGVPHGETARNQRKSLFHGLVCCFHANEVTLIKTTVTLDSKPTTDFCDTFEAPEVPQAVRYLDDAATAFPKSSPTGTVRRRALIFSALSVIHDTLLPNRLSERIQYYSHPKVRHCHELIRSRYPDPALSVEWLAQQLGCTPDHLSRCFRAETGMPVLAYLREQRLARAKDLLQDPKLNISEIAWACGFSSLNYFVRVFRQTTGRPPGQFQRALFSAQSRPS